MKPVYLIICSGMGDTSACVVNEETFNWVNSPYPDFKGETSTYEMPPPTTLAAYIAEEDGDGKCYVTSGSYDNDRALYCRSTEEGFEAMYISLKDVLADIALNNCTVIDTYEGSIY